MGAIPSPFDCYLVNRSLKTLELRMQRHMMSGIEIAQKLDSHSMVEKVLHPCLTSHPEHKLAKQQFYGQSGVFSFYIKGGVNEANKFVKALKIFSVAVSLGGFESLAEIP
jgi:cystathionine gamma-lyase